MQILVKLKNLKNRNDLPSVRKVYPQSSNFWFNRILLLQKPKEAKVMVRLKLIVLEGSLVLRVSEGKKRFYKSVSHLLVGNPNLERHWNSDKERFSSYAVSYSENNQIITEFRQVYLDLIKERPELDAKQVAQYYSSPKQEYQKSEKDMIQPIESVGNSIEKFLGVVIEREKAKQGCNFEVYYKLLKKCRKVIKGFSHLTFQSINYDKCISIAHTFAKHEGYKGTTKAFRSLLEKADNDKNIDFSITQIGNFKFAHYNPKINEIDTKKPDVLSPEQLKTFMKMDMCSLTPTYPNRYSVELYYDFCVFMFHSFLAPCDVIKLKYKDITKEKTICVKRKKTHKPVEVPVNPIMENIINKYRGQTKNGYVFPIMDDEKEKEYKTKDFTFKKFRERVNTWLKIIGVELKTDYDLYAYVFRHTAITVALDNGVPISYVAMVAGTSIEMIQKHYYNGSNTKNTERLQLAFINASI